MRCAAGFGLIGVLVGMAAPAFAQADAGQVPTTVPEMWKAWCARCHGEDGRGGVKEPTVTIRPIDFTDCSVTSGRPIPIGPASSRKAGTRAGCPIRCPGLARR